MPTSLLVLGGSGFVGWAIVAEGLARGWEVTTFNRGCSGDSDPRATQLHGDRTDPDPAILAPLAQRDWDVVADTWSGAPRAARDSAIALAQRAGRYVYISSASVYAGPPAVGFDETAPTVEADPDGPMTDYAADKRGAELAITAAFGERALLARAGLILGPHEDVGRLPWWLNRIAAGGEVLAPGPPELPLQMIDARDLARFVLDAAPAGLGGPCNVVSRRGHATTASLLEACKDATGVHHARLRWFAPEVLARAGIEPWSELPIWIPPGHEAEAMHGANTERAHAAGLRCRPIAETVAETWSWLQSLDGPPPQRPDRPAPGLAPEKERAVLALTG
jgi:2'-hydroxyisoflavone reductase